MCVLFFHYPFFLRTRFGKCNIDILSTIDMVFLLTQKLNTVLSILCNVRLCKSLKSTCDKSYTKAMIHTYKWISF